MEEHPPVTTFERAIEAIESAVPLPDPFAPSCLGYRLRPSEEAEILRNLKLNPPPPWGIKVNLARSFLGPEKCLILGKKIMLNKTLTYLDLTMNDMGEEAAEKFFAYLTRNSVLKHLCVNGNNIGDRGAIAAAPCLLTLESFHCSSNGITDDGATALSEYLKKSPTIKTLALRNNRISEAGIECVLAALIPSDEPVVEAPPPENATFDSSNTVSLHSPENSVLPPSTNRDAGDGSQREEEMTPPAEPTFNSTLHTLWVDQNVGVSEELLMRIATVLAERFPKPVAPPKKKKGGKKKS